jgi:hypothetical protein
MPFARNDVGMIRAATPGCLLGTHGRRGLARVVMGSDAEQVVRACSVPVLLVRGAMPPSAIAQRVEAAVG